MISDTLSDAIYEIQSYRREYPQYYEDIAAEIDSLIKAMEALRVKLDTPSD